MNFDRNAAAKYGHLNYPRLTFAIMLGIALGGMHPEADDANKTMLDC